MKKLLLFSTFCFWHFFTNAQTNFINQDSVFAQSSDCAGGVNICIDSIQYDNISNYRFFLDGAPFSTTFEPCREDTIHTYGVFVVFQNNETGPFVLDSVFIDGKKYTIPSFTSFYQLVDSFRVWDNTGNWQYEPLTNLLVGTSRRVYSCMEITGKAFGGHNLVCYNDGFNSIGLKFRVNPGFHQFVVEQIATGIRDTVKLRAACVTPEVVRETMFIGTQRAYCVNVSQLLGTPQSASFTNFCAKTTTKVNFSNVNNFCIDYAGVAAGTDTACLRVCDQYGICDTTYLYVTAQPNTGRFYEYRDTISLGLNRQKCNINVPAGTLTVFENMCPTRSGTSISFSLDNPNSHCVTYRGTSVGIDTACIRVCNNDPVPLCDTTQFYITGIAPRGKATILYDTVFVDSVKTNCTYGRPTGTITKFNNFCSSSSGTNVFFSLDNSNNCVSYKGLAIGTNNACVEVCNAEGTCDTLNFFVTVKANTAPPSVTNRIFRDTITRGLSRQKCITTVPTGIINLVQNFCQTASGREVSFNIDPVSYCVTYQGLAVGFDTACFRVCNALNACDTTTFIIETKAPADPNVGASYTFTDTITVGLNRQKCDIKIPVGQIATVQNLCTTASGTQVGFSIDPVTRCIVYQGLAVGVDSACVRVCNLANVCDTTTLIIEAKAVPVNSRRTHVFTDTITVGLNRQKCDFAAPFGSTLIENICTNRSGTEIKFDVTTASFCVTYTGLAVGTDTACIRICNASNLCDTTYMYIQGRTNTRPLITPSVDTIKPKIYQKITYCPDQTELAGSPVNLIKFCTPATFNNSTISIDSVKKCVSAVGLSAGVDTFCIAICNTAGFCDTTTLYVRVSTDTFRTTPSVDSIKIKIGELKVYCPDSTELASGNLTNISSCTTTTMKHSTMIFNNLIKCVESRGTSAGKDTACVILCNSIGLCDTTTLYITVTSDTVKPIADIARVTVKIAEKLVFTNIDTTQIFGRVDTVYDACPGKNGSRARMVLDKQAKTVTITGVNVGRDTMCIVVCNKASKLCDTTTIIATVIDTVILTSIKAFNDFDTVKLGRTRDISVYKNDSLQGLTAKFLTIIKQPIRGTADTISFRDGILKYKAGRLPSSCGLDSFTYRVCVDTARTVCSEATVVIEVKCPEDLKAYTGISPNGDGKNDAFYIEGLQKYPDNTLLIFNRWGNQVYKAKNYDNNWQGTWNGNDLPDGTYFFMLNDDAKGEVILTGYLQILR